MNRLTLTLVMLTFLTSCSEVKTTDPNEVYQYWTGSTAPNEVELLRGQYWESAHWTREYIMFLKLKPAEEWWSEFISQNQIQRDNSEWIAPGNAPKWFDPANNSIMYSRGDDLDHGSRYFKDTLTNECYIYEIQF